MSRLFLKGCGTALLTPFKGTEVDYDAYRKCVLRQVDAGVHFLVPLATTGETPTLSREEKKRLLEITKDCSGGLPLVVGCGSNSLAATLENISLVGKDADALLVVVPFYNKPTQEGQYQYFKAVSEATDLPIVMYNVPGRTGVNMSAETCLRLAKDCPNIIATKEASGNYSLVSDILRSAPEGFSVLSGDDDMTLAFMATGAQGVISVASNIAPAEVSGLVVSMLSGDIDSARALHHCLSPLFKACFVESNPIPAKAAMAALGLMKEDVRLPLVKASDSTKKLMSQILATLWK